MYIRTTTDQSLQFDDLNIYSNKLIRQLKMYKICVVAIY